MATMYDDLARPPLNEAELRRALTGSGSRWSDLVVVAETASTNSALAARGRADGCSQAVLIAEHQTAGRGRRDRTWSAPPRSSVTMSALVRPREVPVSRWPWLSLLTGLAVAAAIQQATRVPAMLKWPNDVVVEDRKLAGILLETVDAPGGPAAVIGVGLNVTTTEQELPVPGATSLRLEGALMTDRGTLIKAILRQLQGLLGEWERAGGEPGEGLRAAYRSACTTLDNLVRLELPDGSTVEGEAVGIDDAGRLVVHTGSRRQAFAAGDVTHVRRRD
jgi:BirA family biotin operon repressor/biotin-[acetyl-CoA-carboxylase] ligase